MRFRGVLKILYDREKWEFKCEYCENRFSPDKTTVFT